MQKVKLINLPKIEDPSGNLTSVKENKYIVFNIKRVLYNFNFHRVEVQVGHFYKINSLITIAATLASMQLLTVRIFIF